jgi:hypothetical protein
VDVADLVRIFGEPTAPPTATDIGGDHLREENARLQAELSAARAEIAAVRTEGKEERDRLYGILETTQLALADNSPPAKTTLWKRLFGA